MMYATLLNSEDHDAQALSVVDTRPGLCDVKDLLSQWKIAFRGSESQEKDLEVDADDCVDDLQGTTDDNIVQPSKPPRYNKNQHQDEETPTSGGYSGRVLACILNAKVSMGLFVLLLAVGHGACTCLNHTNVHMAAGSKVNLTFKCPSNNCLAKFHNLTEKRERQICEGRKCDEGYTFDEDGLHFIADNKTAGNYSLADHDTPHVEDCIKLTVGAAASNTLPSGLLMALTVVLGYIILQKLTG